MQRRPSAAAFRARLLDVSEVCELGRETDAMDDER